MAERRFDVAVIGAGIVGTAVAHALVRAGARVVVLDAGTPGGGTSRTSFAWLNAVRKEPDVYHRLNADGMAAHHDLASELDGVGHHEGGSLEWAQAADEERELRARVERLGRRGYAAEWITRERARALEPGLAIPSHVPRVAFYARDGWLDAPRFIRRLLDAMAGGGAEIREQTRVRSFRMRDGRVEALVLDDGEIVADSALVCVGPATETFLAPLGVAVPVGRVPGLLAVTSRPASPLGRVVHAPGIHLRPDARGGLLLGATDLDRLVDDTTPPDALATIASTLLDRAAAVFPPARDVALVDARVGVRPMPADGHTIAGRVPGLQNAWVIATHSGVTLGPLLGRLIADEIMGKPAGRQLAPFRPDRFAAR